MHSTNEICWYLQLQQSPAQMLYMHLLGMRHQPLVKNLVKQNIIKRLKDFGFRNSINCKVIACINESFRLLDRLDEMVYMERKLK